MRKAFARCQPDLRITITENIPYRGVIATEIMQVLLTPHVVSMIVRYVSRLRRSLGALTWLAALAGTVAPGLSLAQTGALPTVVPAGTKLVVADQNEALQTLLRVSGEQSRLTAQVSYANFLGGPSILEAFRAGALDLAVVGNTPPIQAHAAGEPLPIVAVRKTSAPDYQLAVRPGLTIASLKDLKGKSIAYAEGTGRQPFVLTALKVAGLSRRDVKLVPLRAGDFPTAIRAGQVDVAALNEPHFSRYLRDFADRKASAIPASEHRQLPTRLAYLYASPKALSDPGKTAAIRQFVEAWIRANDWAEKHPQQWVQAYYVKQQGLREEDGLAIVRADGQATYPLLADSIAPQQGLIDLIQEAGDIPRRLDARQEFDLRFDPVIRAAVASLPATRQ
ncbi:MULTISPECIES: ABC transporter substrate-binding protein [unclassified Cupriavidus]|uniref:ABC transporter substrate-binding protein n=1 Tax=unclassified Cupriavidus TaxID=2640874 RepID=UPI00295ED7D4|nr:ABC transporter substrate-binding protein [Cupriavidus sp. TA19]